METWLYLPNGCKINFPFGNLPNISPIDEANEMYQYALAYTNRLLELGASVNAPGLEDGEGKEQIGFISRRSKINDDGSETPVLDLFPNHDATKFKFMTVYLNTVDDVNAFETASGLKLDSIPLWEGDKHLDRGGAKTDKYIMQLTRPLVVIHKSNERYNPEEPDITKRKPKRLFVRWDTVGTPTPPPPAQQPAASATPASAPESKATGTPQTAENGAKDKLPNWFAIPLQTCFGAFKMYILKELYDNNTFHMNGSLNKHGISDGKVIGAEWATKPASEVVEFLRNRHDENDSLLETA